MINYILYGFCSFWAIWVLFINVMQFKKYEKTLKQHPYVYYPLAAVFVLGYIGDILWNIIFASPIFYVLDRVSGYSHAQSTALPNFKLVKDLGSSHKITLTYRLNTILATRDKNSETYKTALFICKYLLNPYDAGHCKINQTLELYK